MKYRVPIYATLLNVFEVEAASAAEARRLVWEDRQGEQVVSDSVISEHAGRVRRSAHRKRRTER